MMQRSSLWFVAPALLLALLLSQSTASAQGLDGIKQRLKEAMQRTAVPKAYLTDSPGMRKAFREVVSSSSQATVRIKSDGRDAALGAIVGPDGWIITKASRLKDNLVCQLHDGRTFPAEIVGQHAEYDLAMIKIDASGLPSIEWNRQPEPDLGQWVAVPGLGKDPVAVGVVSVLQRKIPKKSGILGVRLEDGEGGAKIVQVVPDSGAAKAGLQNGDVVTECNGKKVSGSKDLVQIVRKCSPDDVVKMVVLRSDETLRFSATLSRRIQGMGPNRGQLQNNMGSKLSERRSGFPQALQHDTVLRPQDCGGPLVDLDGKVLGINIARAGRTESYAIPTPIVLGLMYDLMSGRLSPVSAKVLPEDSAELAPLPEVGTPPEPVE